VISTFLKTSLVVFAVVGLATTTGACGGGKKVEKKTSPPPVDAGSTGQTKIQKLCTTICSGITTKCADSDTKPKAEECVFACVDETDGVIDEARQCVENASDCETATKCRSKFGGDTDKADEKNEEP